MIRLFNHLFGRGGTDLAHWQQADGSSTIGVVNLIYFHFLGILCFKEA